MNGYLDGRVEPARRLSRFLVFGLVMLIAVGGLTVATIFESLKPNYAWAQQVPKDDKRLKTESVTVQSPQGNGTI